MSKRSEKEFILDMYIACERISKYMQNADYQQFLQDFKTQDAIIRNLEILGEASKKISEEFKLKYPNIEWKIIAKTRDKLIHDYFGVDLEIIWDISKIDIPEVKEKLDEIIQKENWEKYL